MKKVLIVDDSPSDIKLVMESLKDHYTLSAATTGEKAIELASTTKPDVILMDVSMPIMNGYETCKHILRKQSANIIFLSSNDTTEEILQGYDAGGIDYITKPFMPDKLVQKIEFALMNFGTYIESTAPEKKHEAVDDLRLIIDFNKKCLHVSDTQILADLIIQTTQAMNLNCCVQLHSNSGIFESASQGSVKKLESEILTRFLQEDGRIFQQSQQLFITYDNIALLVKNMSDSDPKLSNSLKSLIENANTMLLNIDHINSLKQSNSQKLHNALSNLNEELQNMQQQLKEQKQYKKEGVSIMDNVLADMEACFVDLGLTYNQEQTLLSILHAGIDRSLKHYERGADLDEQFEAILKDIEVLLQLGL